MKTRAANLEKKGPGGSPVLQPATGKGSDTVSGQELGTGAGVPLFIQSQALSLPSKQAEVRRQPLEEEEEDLQAKRLSDRVALPSGPRPSAIQRQLAEDEEEAIQTQPDVFAVRRQPLEEEEEDLQAKRLNDRVALPTGSGPSAIQRQPAEEEEETIQTQPDVFAVRRQPLEEEEEDLQAKRLNDRVALPSGSGPSVIQRQSAEEDEETVQPMTDTFPVRRQPLEEEEEALQTKLRVGPPGDQYEKEADSVADQVVRQNISGRVIQPEPDVRIQSKRTQGRESILSAKSSPGMESPGRRGFSRRLRQSKGGGRPLPDGARDFMQQRIGSDFSEVRVHTDTNALRLNQELGARAFTSEKHIFFNANEYNPQSIEGQRLLAHELTHVVQQGSASASAPSVQMLRARGVTRRERAYIVRRYRWFISQLTQLERNATITTEESEGYRNRYSRAIREVNDLARRRETSRSVSRNIWRRGRRLLRYAQNVERAKRHLVRRARFYRGSSRRLTLLSRMTITPRTIRVHEGESARISFILRRRAQSIRWYILESEGSGELTGRMGIREFATTNNDPGYKYAYWDGTFPGSRNRPPETRTYRVRLTVRDLRGRGEGVADQVRVENPRHQVVHPRHASGYALSSLVFDGRRAVLSDDHGNQITARAVSGLKRNHRRNPRRIDYTQPRYQWVRNKGPLPEGSYTMTGGGVQQPQLERGRLRYPASRRATAAVWGVGRIALRPYSRRSPSGAERSAFFFHLDVNNDGTAGCIGIHPGDVGKFNSMISLIRRMPGRLNVKVRY